MPHWFTMLQELLKKKITKENILIVKLLCFTINHTTGKYETDTKICPAKLIIGDKSATWYIYDIVDDTLFIETPLDSKRLGFIFLPNDDELFGKLNLDVPHDMYIISACFILNLAGVKFERYKIIDKANNEIITTASTYQEAVSISEALKQNHYETEIIFLSDEEAFPTPNFDILN